MRVIQCFLIWSLFTTLVFSQSTDSLYIHYPKYLTKIYTSQDTAIVVADDNFPKEKEQEKEQFPFNELQIKGHITRGVTVGNNQDAVTNSNMNLQLEGYISNDVKIKASIQDDNMPVKYGGYSQKITEFDNVFVEIHSNDFYTKAGDLMIENNRRKLLNFSKKVQGLQFKYYTIPDTLLKEKENTQIVLALSQGMYAKSEFVGIEGNQGPYKLKGDNAQLHILIVPNSERVFVNGVLLKRGKDKDYEIDYNAGEIKFTPYYPMGAEKRVVVEYQYTDRNYTRFLGYSNTDVQVGKWKIGASIFNETDIKSMPLVDNPPPAARLSIGGTAVEYTDETNRITTEIAFSNHHLDGQQNAQQNHNSGLAIEVDAQKKMALWGKNLHLLSNFQFIQPWFKTIERLQTIEFNRDWGVMKNQDGNRYLWSSGVRLDLNHQNELVYKLELLGFSSHYKGVKNIFTARYKLSNTLFSTQSSYLKSEDDTNQTDFLQTKSTIIYTNKDYQAQLDISGEQQVVKPSKLNLLNKISQRFLQSDLYLTKGDTASVFLKMAYTFRVNDSVYLDKFQRASVLNGVSAQTQLLKNKHQNITLYANYRHQHFEKKANDNTVNSVLSYSDKFFKIIDFHINYQIGAGGIPRQDYKFIEVEPGMGSYMWNDYNGNGLQELEEFEIAPYPDLAKYEKMLLPNQSYQPVYKNKTGVNLRFDFSQWQNKDFFSAVLSHFSNHTNAVMDKSVDRGLKNWIFNPLTIEDAVSVNNNISNTTAFNFGKQHYSTSYTFNINNMKNLLSIGTVESFQKMHKIDFNHLVQKMWHLQFEAKKMFSTYWSQHYKEKNYHIKRFSLHPKVAYIFSDKMMIEGHYQYQRKTQENLTTSAENLTQHRWGASFKHSLSSEMYANADLFVYHNKFQGNAASTVGYQMLEGLQPGVNATWRLMVNYAITDYLSLNISYQGRSSENAPTVHNGSVQLRANF